jgi:hypothetical protein
VIKKYVQMHSAFLLDIIINEQRLALEQIGIGQAERPDWIAVAYERAGAIMLGSFITPEVGKKPADIAECPD